MLTGDATDPVALTAAVATQQAVIDTIGGKTPYRTTDLEQKVARAVIAAMRQQGVQRLIAVSALGVGDSKQQASFLFRRLILPTFLRGSTKDKAAMEREIQNSGLTFVLARPAVLNDQPPVGRVRVF